MSERSEANRVIKRCEDAGLDVMKLKHGGYAILNRNGRVVTRVPSNGNGPPHWLRRVRRDLRDYGVVV